MTMTVERPNVLINAQNVNNVQFTSRILKRGYDEIEVDSFLDDVIATLRWYEAMVDDIKILFSETPEPKYKAELALMLNRVKQLVGVS